MMLDAKRTFDELVEWHASDERTRDAVLSNRIYQELSNAVAGSQEYMAMEKLHELHQEGRYDLLVLDTPPTRNALDFLDAPESCRASSTRARSRRSPRRAARPEGAGPRLRLGVLGAEARHRHRPARGPVGVLPSFGDMAEGFRERAERVNALLADSRSAFVLVDLPASRRGRGGGLVPPPPAGRRAAVRRRGGQPRARRRRGATRPPSWSELLGDPAWPRKVMRNFEDERRLAAQDRATSPT